MIVGKGFLSKKFSNYANDEKFVIFDDGVTNSREINVVNYKEERRSLRKALLRMNKGAVFVYFSTCSIYDPEEINSMYVKHKLEMENIISRNKNAYLIFRKSQLVGDFDNRDSIINYLVNAISQNVEFQLWKNAYRNILDVDDFFSLVDNVMKSGVYSNKIVNVANKHNDSIFDIISKIENVLQKKARYRLLDKGTEYTIDISDINSFLRKSNVNFNEDYLATLLDKYYNPDKK